MKKNKNLLEVPNINSSDAQLKKIIYKVEDNIFNRFFNSFSKSEYLCVCSGGTTSSCARDNFITLDLRKEYDHIHLEKEKNLIKIGGGVIMKDLMNFLGSQNKIFPTGLSKLPGAGYLLTGGISPLSRRYGLAIDNIETIKGYLGNGTFISLEKNNLSSDQKLLWEGFKGAAPFLAIITEIGLKTFQAHPIQIIEGFINDNELSKIINLAEGFPENLSLQWIYAQDIYIYILAEIRNDLDKEITKKYLNKLENFSSLKIKTYENYNQINFFPKELDLFELNKNNHSEVISLLGEDLKERIQIFIKCMKEIIRSKPNNSCYVASQQLGGKTKEIDPKSSFFIHRKSTWKPWIYASWKKDDLKEKEIVLNWMNESWEKLKIFFPKIHLAQIHNHLNSHEEEVYLSFEERLSELKTLKNICDPESILPPL
ncbi:FAD linked oxidase, N-terminal [Prochlorococcus marinus str. MIT 9515]|uniref:FAD linked oxidase, N-terminal n=1 Tax=Prochlorococcus marinus (strain MIT 9515) TaxID=167542 RepID=A2BVV9_PROM5|nr:FAD-binding protein [Prochlorococcus marinus]ABM71920.1 FAD linked oxidase, N-terminal [Prochlorococcus marinus str. MIT 9515]